MSSTLRNLDVAQAATELRSMKKTEIPAKNPVLEKSENSSV
jgi:hypothetical protein